MHKSLPQYKYDNTTIKLKVQSKYKLISNYFFVNALKYHKYYHIKRLNLLTVAFLAKKTRNTGKSSVARFYYRYLINGYLVPKRRSPASPKPGTMYPSSFK